MSTCQGLGECIQQCVCSCYDDDECEIPSATCICGHRNHKKLNGGEAGQKYWKSECSHHCHLVECRSYRNCGQKLPQILRNRHNGLCIDCAKRVGKIKFLDKIEYCRTCRNYTNVIENDSKHNVCLDCWWAWMWSPPS